MRVLESAYVSKRERKRERESERDQDFCCITHFPNMMVISASFQVMGGDLIIDTDIPNVN